MFGFMNRFQKLFLPIFLLTFKVKVKGHGFRIYGTSYHVIVFGSFFAVKRSPKHGHRFISNEDNLGQVSNDLEIPTPKVKVI